MRFLPTYIRERDWKRESQPMPAKSNTKSYSDTYQCTPFNKGADVTTHILQKKGREKEDTNICHSFSSHFGCGRGIKRESLLKHFFLLLTSSSCWNCRQSDLETDKTRTTARWSLCVNIDHYWGYFSPKWHFPNLVTWWFS